MKNIFKQIIDRELPAQIVFENDRFIAIKDIHPLAPVHLLIIPKQEFKSLQHMPKKDLSLISEAIEVAQKLAKEFDVEDQYRLLTNIGPNSGQSIFHLHFHLIGGKRLGPMA